MQCLAGRPVHRPSAEKVDVQVVDGLAAFITRIDDGAITFAEIFLTRDFSGDGKQLAEQRRIATGCLSERRDMLPRRNQHMDRRGRIDVSECKAIVVFIDNG